MNKHRGVADALGVKAFAPDAIILDDSGFSCLNVFTGQAGKQRTCQFICKQEESIQYLL